MKVITTNKKAFHDYSILETYEAGIALKGDEVKSIRNKQVTINDSFATVHDGQIWLLNCFIGSYAHAFDKKQDERQRRKLLLRKQEINKLVGAVSRKGLTLIPLKMYISDRGFVKIELGVASHKKKAEKKGELRERDIARETRRELKQRNR